jgi:hypothetical protein
LSFCLLLYLEQKTRIDAGIDWRGDFLLIHSIILFTPSLADKKAKNQQRERVWARSKARSWEEKVCKVSA